MDFSLSSEQQMFQKMFRDFAAKEVAKVADQADKQEGVPAKLLKRMAAQGFLGALLPEEPYGGAGLDFVTFTLLLEALAAECASTALIAHVHNTPGVADDPRAWQRRGSKESLLPEMAAGERIGAFALTEAGAGSDPTRLRTRAARQGDAYVLNGAKTWVSNGGIAGVFVVFAATDPAAGARGLSAFVVPAETPGLIVGGREKTLGLRGASITRLYLRRLSRAGRPSPGRRGGRVQDRAGSARLRPRGHRRGVGGRGAADPGAGRQVRQRAAAVRRARSATSRRSRSTWPTPRPRSPRPRGWCARPRGWPTRASRSRRRPPWPSSSPAGWSPK